MVKIIILTDIHGNLPALRAVLNAARAEGYDALFQTGDAIAIGPYPRECLDLLGETPKVGHVKGNHEVYFTQGISDPPPSFMSAGEAAHQRWVHAQLTLQHHAWISGWPFSIAREIEGVRVAFQHSGLGETGQDIQGIPQPASPADLDHLFAAQAAGLVFYGHRHEAADATGQARYINPGSLGCYSSPLARYIVATFQRGQYRIERRTAAYDDAALLRAFEDRAVPDWEFIRPAFFGR